LKWIREYTTISHIKIMVFVLPTIAHVESGRVLTLEISKNKKKNKNTRGTLFYCTKFM